MGCFCITPPASQAQRKVYNILVPDIFPLTAPDIKEPIPAVLTRKIAKLEEYIQMNPHKIPKVSRRLARRIRAAVPKEDQHGQVKLAVHTYIYLLAKSTSSEATYTANYFATELIGPSEPIIPLLLNASCADLKMLGAELVASYSKAQGNVDHKLEALEPLVPTLCEYGRTSGSKEGGEAAQALTQLRLASLHALQEIVMLCVRLRCVPTQLEAIEDVVFYCLGLYDKGAVLLRTSSAVDMGFGKSMGIEGQAPAGDTPEAVARNILKCLGAFIKDLATVHQVMATFFKFMDSRHKWGEEQLVESLMDQLARTCEENRVVLYTCLVSHTTAPNLSLAERVVVVQQAAEQGSQQEEAFQLTAISAALSKLPEAWAAAGGASGSGSPELQELKQAILGAVQQVARSVADSAQVFEAIAACLKAITDDSTPAAVSSMALECCQAAADAARPFGSAGAATSSGGAQQAQPRRSNCSPCPPQGVPTTLLQQVAQVLKAGSAAQRAAGSQVLVSALEKAGTSAVDDRRAVLVMQAVEVSLQRPDTTPADYVSAAVLLGKCVSGQHSMAALNAARMSISLTKTGLAAAAIAGGKAAAGGARACCELLLANTLLGLLSAAHAAPKLLSHLLPVPEAVPGLKQLPGGVLEATAEVLGSQQQEEQAAPLLAAARAKATDGSAWADKLAAELLKLKALGSYSQRDLLAPPFAPVLGSSAQGSDASPRPRSQRAVLRASPKGSRQELKKDVMRVIDLIGGSEDGSSADPLETSGVVLSGLGGEGYADDTADLKAVSLGLDDVLQLADRALVAKH